MPTDATTVTGRPVSSRRRSMVTSPTARRATIEPSAASVVVKEASPTPPSRRVPAAMTLAASTTATTAGATNARPLRFSVATRSATPARSTPAGTKRSQRGSGKSTTAPASTSGEAGHRRRRQHDRPGLGIRACPSADVVGGEQNRDTDQHEGDHRNPEARRLVEERGQVDRPSEHDGGDEKEESHASRADQVVPARAGCVRAPVSGERQPRRLRRRGGRVAPSRTRTTRTNPTGAFSQSATPPATPARSRCSVRRRSAGRTRDGSLTTSPLQRRARRGNRTGTAGSRPSDSVSRRRRPGSPPSPP